MAMRSLWRTCISPGTQATSPKVPASIMPR